MKNIRINIVHWLQIGVFVAAWIVVLQISGVGLEIDLEAVKKLPVVVTVYSAFHVVFTSWAWKLPVFRGWLVPFPDLRGTWEGFLEPTGNESGSGTNQRIPAVLRVRQTFDSIGCTLYTEESESLSTAAQLYSAGADGLLRLSYTYNNRPRVGLRERSAIHDGAVLLRFVERPKRTLKGEYWTNRRSSGEMEFTFRSRDLNEALSFEKPLPPAARQDNGT